MGWHDAVGVDGIAIGGVGLTQTGLPWTTRPVGNKEDPRLELGQPAVLCSRDGVLRPELVVSRAEVEAAGAKAKMLTYNGSLPGSAWLIRPVRAYRSTVDNG